ncbi:MAG: hypothetical protein FJY66_05110 [Calditrichaeota bacterium]|nr:hypothetical protein [Calditrichota bacterium]
MKIAYDRNQEGIFAVRNEEGQFLLPYLSEDFISFPLDIFGEAVLNLETGGLLKRESDTYRITLKGRHEYEGGPKSSQHKAFIIASCSRAVRPAVEVYREVLKNFDYEGIFQEEEEPVNTIEADIFQNIDNSKLIIADMTEHRPNCYLELGYAMALGKRIILVISEKHRNEELLLPSGEKILKDGLTFDTRQRRYTFYKDADDLREELTKRIRANLEMIQKAAEI